MGNHIAVSVSFVRLAVRILSSCLAFAQCLCCHTLGWSHPFLSDHWSYHSLYFQFQTHILFCTVLSSLHHSPLPFPVFSSFLSSFAYLTYLLCHFHTHTHTHTPCISDKEKDQLIKDHVEGAVSSCFFSSNFHKRGSNIIIINLK